MKHPLPGELDAIKYLKNLPKPGDTVIIEFMSPRSIFVTQVRSIDTLGCGSTIVFYLYDLDSCFFHKKNNRWAIREEEVNVFWNIDWEYDQSSIIPC